MSICILCDAGRVTVEEQQSLARLQSVVGQKGGRIHVSRSSVGHEEYFVALEWRARARDGSLNMGIAYAGHGIAPQFYLEPTGAALLIGVDDTVVHASAGTEIISAITLPSVFYEFIPVETHHLVLAVHELGVEALTADGHVLWKHLAGDILVSWKVRDGALELQDQGGARTRLGLASGGQANHGPP